LSVAADVEKLEREIRQLERENGRLEDKLERAESEAYNFEHQLNEALERVEELEPAEEYSKPFRPDVKRMDAGDWIHSSSQCVCTVCGFQFWEHATVPGYMWIHRICDGRLVKL
jgi:hypothetical protein